MLSRRIAELGLELLPAVKPVASYVPAVRAGNLIFVSGQLPMKGGKLLLTGAMTPKRDLQEAQAAMARCFLNGIAAASLVVDIDRITSVVRLGAYIASVPDFTEQHKVANGASNLAQKIFGDSGMHARFAIGVPSLPLNSTVELEIIFQAEDD